MPNAPITELLLTTSGTELVLPKGVHVVGRSHECAVRIDDPLTSRRHAVFIVSGESVVVRDLGSRNGVLVNGEDVETERALVEGDLVAMGSHAFTVRQIRRAGDARKLPAIATPERPKGAPLARIAVRKVAAPEPADAGGHRPLVDPPLSDRTQTQDGSVTRAAGSYLLIAEAASRAIALTRVERAEKILEAPLLEVLRAVKGGVPIEREIVEMAVEHALVLAERCEGKKRLRWVDYVHDLHDARRAPIPLQVADRLAHAMQLGEG
jgi:hypothetical protein